VNNQNLIVVGKINGPWGIKGFVKFTPNINELGLYEINNTFYLDNQKTELLEIVTQNKKKYLRFTSINNRNDAEEIAGKILAIDPRDFRHINFTQNNENRIGMQVRSKDSIIGIIEQIIQTGANDVFVVQTQSGELLVPDIDDYIVSIDEGDNLMIIQNEDGL
tara:strand:+ start:290 stop:778 length:489 start_codon:yes stop_codon:yes gene_type:complete